MSGMVSAPAIADDTQWTVLGCSGCHSASVPPDITTTSTNGSGSTQLGLSESWMGSSSLLKSRANGALVGGFSPSSAMLNLTTTHADDVWGYLVKVRDGVIAASPSFSSVVAGSGSTTSVITVTVTNYRASDLDYTITVSSVSGSDFTLVNSGGTPITQLTGTCTAASTTAGNACAVTARVKFAPGGTTGGTRTGTLQVDLAGPGSEPAPQSQGISLSATATAPHFVYTSAKPAESVGNPSVTARAGTTSDFLVGTISNTGDATLSITGLTVTAAGGVSSTYAVGTGTGACGSTLLAATACNVYVRFGAVAGDSTATLSISHSDANHTSPMTTTIYGHGTQSLLTLVSPGSATLSFGAVEIGKTSTQNLVFRNDGDATLTFATLAPPAHLAVTGGCPVAPTTLAIGASCTMFVTFGPVDTSSVAPSWTISSDAPVSAVVTLSGVGTPLSNPVVTFATPTIPDTAMGDVSTEFTAVTIVNNRARAVRYSLGTLVDYQLGTENCVGGTGPGNRDVPANGGSCTIALKFAPTVGTSDAQRPENVVVSFTGTSPDTNPPTSTSPSPLSGKALLPLGLSTQSLAPATVDGTPTTITMLLTNRSKSSITLTSLAISDTHASDYARDASSVCVDGTVLGVGASCTYVLRFNPPALADGVRAAKLTITHSALGSPQVVSLAGIATPAPQGEIQLDTTSLAFPDTQLGATSTLSRTIRNVGNLALTFNAFTFGGANPTEFERGGSCDTAVPLAMSGGECTLTVTFRPASVGSKSASLAIASDARTPSVSLNASGTAIPVPVPAVSLPASLLFDKQTVGGIYPTRSVTLTNSGTATLNIAAITTQGAAFALAPTSTCGSTLAAKASCTIDVAYAATAAGVTDTGALVITSNAAGSPHSVALSGVGSASVVPVLTWAPVATPIEFGSPSVGTPSGTQTLTLINQGPGGATLAVINTIGTNAASFAVVGGTCAPSLTLFEAAPGATTGAGTCTVTLQFVPGSSGDKTAQLQVASTGSMPPTMALHGVGLGGPAPSVTMSATALPFASTRVGAQSLPSELTLTSDGSGSLRVLALDVSGPYVVQSKSCPQVPFTLVPNSSCTLTLTFAPQSEGAAAGMLHITTDADPATREVALSGSGDAPANVSSGGGCSIASGESVLDPALWTMVLLALAVLAMRARERSARRGGGR